MAIRSLKNNTFSRSLLVGNARFVPTSFESIATVTVGSGGAANVEFTSIPAIYKHLQVRCFSRSDKTNDIVSLIFKVNSDTGSNYAWHGIYADGSTVGAHGGSSTSYAVMPQATSDYLSANCFGVAIIDILDYANTNKYKTLRGLGGWETNSAGRVNLRSGLWQNTSAITSLTITPDPSGNNWKQYSHFALYGIKGVA